VQFETHVATVRRVTPTVKSFRFPRPAALDYRAGQYMLVTIRINGEAATKPFTISSSPTERDHLQFTKKLTGHPFSNALDALTPGDWARLDAPHGAFTFAGEHAKLALLAGGIGITPLRSICRYCADAGVDTDIVLLYGSRTEQDLAFREEFEAMQATQPTFRAVFTLEQPPPGWTGARGFIDATTIRREIPDYAARVFYVCGPPVMIRVMEALLGELGVHDDRIRTERFAGY
jgi:ferredoxin-NADP reductase